LLTDRSARDSWVHRLGEMIAPAEVSWQRDLTSNYDNTVFDPSASYQFGIGGIDAFRGIDRPQLATTAGRVQTFTTRGALNLPLSLNLQTRFDRGTSETWTRRSLDGFQALITSERRTYPDVSLRWSWRPAKIKKIISMLSLNGSYLITEQSTLVPNDAGGLADRSSTKSSGQPISASITWAFLGDLTTNGSIDRRHREDARPGSITIGDTRTQSLDFGRTFPLPKSWNTKSGKLRTRFSYSSEETVATVGGSTNTGAATITGPDLSVLTNNGSRTFNLNADTDVSDQVSFSLNGSHVLRFDRNFNRRSTNTLVSISLRLLFFAGELK
jgi:hypothetical protein